MNATVEMARLIDRMARELPGLAPTVNVGVTASAGVFYGVYPGSARARIDAV